MSGQRAGGRRESGLEKEWTWVNHEGEHFCTCHFNFFLEQHVSIKKRERVNLQTIHSHMEQTFQRGFSYLFWMSSWSHRLTSLLLGSFINSSSIGPGCFQCTRCGLERCLLKKRPHFHSGDFKHLGLLCPGGQYGAVRSEASKSVCELRHCDSLLKIEQEPGHYGLLCSELLLVVLLGDWL